MTGQVLAVVGLKREARLVAGPNVQTLAGGGDAQALAYRLTQTLDDKSIVGVVSIGLAGALSPSLRVGDWVAADTVISGDVSFPTDARWSAELRARLGLGARSGGIAGVDHMVVDASTKSSLRRETGAVAVDMESHITARAAAERSLPFVALRVISDSADQALPKAAQAGMKKDGGMNLPAVLRSLAMDPRQLPALVRTGKEADLAFRRLALLGGQDGGLLGPGIGCPYLGQLVLDVP